MFEVGQFVRVKPNANVIDHKSVLYVDEMNEYLGVEDTIYKIERRSDGLRYKLSNAVAKGEDADYVNGDGHWMFVEEWLEPVVDNMKIDVNEYDKVFE